MDKCELINVLRDERSCRREDDCRSEKAWRLIYLACVVDWKREVNVDTRGVLNFLVCRSFYTRPLRPDYGWTQTHKGVTGETRRPSYVPKNWVRVTCLSAVVVSPDTKQVFMVYLMTREREEGLSYEKAGCLGTVSTFENSSKELNTRWRNGVTTKHMKKSEREG